MSQQANKSPDPWAADLKKPENVPVVEFLRQLPEDEIIGLVRTTTAGLVSTQSVDEAISIILHFSDGISILNRKRVKKEYLANYLITRKVKFSPQSDKSKLCNLVLKEWGQGTQNALQFNNEATTNSGSHANVTSAICVYNGNGSSSNEKIRVETTYRSALFEEVEMTDNSFEEGQRRRARMQAGEQLSFDFTTWFYPRLNALEDFIPGHFWSDCNFSMQLQTPLDSKCFNVLRDGNEVFALLRRLVAEERCGFNPNTLYGIGIRGKINPHGLAQVAVCGTVHKGNVAFGTFEQTFGLMKDPTDDNRFKIKFSLLRIREAATITHSGVPAIAPVLSSDVIEELEDDE